MPPGEGEIGHGGVLKRIAMIGRFACCFLKHRRDFPKALDCDCSNDRVPVLEMGVEDWLAIFDLLRQAADRDGVPSLGFRD
jgi:hypothetical protein